ncbi:hypothetical protein KFZ76_06945 [Methylovulum psychrotolerans]|uniref:hypothetical protein n=1 Tax=Methylovulum psychrotolerans TaxID=1704499 RepID=UPI001BFEF11F|nr:hypothetical protein [Methylovulum psychrotolerans]MBT9097447.1 hypothetical protein [Methylovulum psychrotolerans]
MKSIQSPYSGEALVLNVSQPFVYNSRNDQCRNVSDFEIGVWLTSHGELRNVEVNDLKELKTSLDLYFGCRTALQLALFSIDSDLDSSLHQQSVALLEPLLKNEAIFIRLRDLFCIEALPESSIKILKQLLECAKEKSFYSYVSLFTYIVDKQSAIKQLASVWKTIEESLILDTHYQHLLDQTLSAGLFNKVIEKECILEVSELIFLIIVKIRPSLDRGFILKVVPKAIDYKKMSDVLGSDEVIKGIEHFSLWKLVDISAVLKFEMSSAEKTTPFEYDKSNNTNIAVSSLVNPGAIIPLDCFSKLKIHLEEGINDDISDNFLYGKDHKPGTVVVSHVYINRVIPNVESLYCPYNYNMVSSGSFTTSNENFEHIDDAGEPLLNVYDNILEIKKRINGWANKLPVGASLYLSSKRSRET